MKYTQIPVDTFQKLQLNAGILVDSFTPETGEIGNILGATTGGITFNANPTYSDFGEDVDNCPNNMKELKHLDSYDPTMSGTFLTCSPALAKALIGTADVDANSSIHVIPRNDVLAGDFIEVWWIGDYSDVNLDGSDVTAGYLAIHMMNALNQGGFQITTEKNGKGQLAFEFHGHYSMDTQDVVPFEIYCKAGSAPALPLITLNKHVLELTVGDTFTFHPTVVPSSASISWNSSATGKASVSSGVVTAAQAGSTTITASITVDGVAYTDTCTVIVNAAS